MKMTINLILILIVTTFFLLSMASVTLPNKRIVLNAYSHLAVYDLSYRPDSTDGSARSAIMALLIGNQGSVFGAYGNLNYDTSLYMDRKRGGNRWAFRIQPRRDFYINYRIFKQNNHVTTYDKIAVSGSPYFKYSETMSSIKWSVLPDTATISGYACQKATCTYGGRSWTGWFTMNVPVSDGPYKFCGLPGLIVQIADEKQSWKFTLTQFINTSYNYFEEALQLDQVEKTSKENFLQLLKASYDNGFEMEQQYGVTFLDSIDVEKRRYLDRAKKENNWIEKYDVR